MIDFYVIGVITNDRLKYGWTHHDGETFGIEQIYDENLHLNIQWLKQVNGQHGGDWTARINVTPQVCHQKIMNRDIKRK